MDIQITIPDDQVPAWELWRTSYNASSDQPPITLEQLVGEVYVGSKTSRLAAQKQEVDLCALKPLGRKFLEAPSEVREQVEQLLES